MAEEKKPEGWNFDPMELLFAFLILAALLSALGSGLWSYFASGNISFFGFRLSGVIDFFRNNSQIFKALGYVVAGAGAVGTFIYNKKSDAILNEVRSNLYPSDMPKAAPSEESAKTKQRPGRWEKIVSLSESQNSSDWRLAVIEADIMLDELLQKLQLPGDTMGEKLKAVEKSDFTTIDQAWEAHKARNMIAHEGSDYLVNQREIRRIIYLYEAVFKEFYLI